MAHTKPAELSRIIVSRVLSHADGARNSYHVKDAPIRPVYDVYPPDLSEEELPELHRTVGAVIREAKITGTELLKKIGTMVFPVLKNKI